MSLLKHYIESFSYHETISRTEKIEKGRLKLFDFDYPFYDETKRKGFETNFIRHFYMREIGADVTGLFKFRLEDYLNLNMPYWNELFKSELMNFPVFEDFDYTITEGETKTKNAQTDTDVVGNRTSQTDTDMLADKTGQTDTNGVVDKTGQTDTNGVVDKTSQTEVDALKNKTSLTDSDTTREETGTQGQALLENVNNQTDTTDTTNENNFHRNVFSDTPQGDLQLSTNGDGTGVVTHASTLEEDKDTKKSTGVGSQTDVNRKDQQIDTTTTENETKNVNTDKTENETRSVDTGVTEKETQLVGTGVVEKETQLVGTGIVEKETKNIGTGVLEDETQATNTDLKEQHAKDNLKALKGKKGTTDYADLLLKYRATFMRIERDIFNEINKEGLFLLVYGGR